MYLCIRFRIIWRKKEIYKITIKNNMYFFTCQKVLLVSFTILNDSLVHPAPTVGVHILMFTEGVQL